jgi:hypothetical protein
LRLVPPKVENVDWGEILCYSPARDMGRNAPPVPPDGHVGDRDFGCNGVPTAVMEGLGEA